MPAQAPDPENSQISVVSGETIETLDKPAGYASMSRPNPDYDRSDPREPRVVAVGLLTDWDLSVLGQGFKRAYRLDEGNDFHDLLAAIDRAERELQRPPVKA